MARKLEDTFMMGPLLRQYNQRFDRDGEEAALRWAESLSEAKQAQLAMEMELFLADEQSQVAITAMRQSVERGQIRLGFTKN